MPRCPGCRQRVPYPRLPVHQRYCPGIWTDGIATDQQSRAIEQLYQNLRAKEQRLEARVEQLERSLSEPGGSSDSGRQ